MSSSTAIVTRRQKRTKRAFKGWLSHRLRNRMRIPKAISMRGFGSGRTYRFTRWVSSTGINTAGGINYSLTDNTAEALEFSTPFVTYNVGTGGTSGSANYASIALKFCLGDLPDVSEFTALFDQYRIVGIKLLLIPVSQMGLSAAAGVNAAADGYVKCIVHSCIDNDDNTQFVASEAGVLAMMEYKNYRVRGLGGSARPVINRYFKPKILNVVQDVSAGTTARSIATGNPWLDCATTTTPYFGLKTIWELHTGTNATNYCIQFRMVAKYIVEFRDTR